MGVYWLTNSTLTLGQSIFVRQKLKGEGLDIKKIQLENMEARSDPYANQVKLLTEEGIIKPEQVQKFEESKGFQVKTDFSKIKKPNPNETIPIVKPKEDDLLKPWGPRRRPAPAAAEDPHELKTVEVKEDSKTVQKEEPVLDTKSNQE